MAIDGKRIKNRVESAKNARGRVTLYLTNKVYQDFQEHCGDAAASAVIEALMQEYIASTPGPHRDYYKRLLTLLSE